VAGFLGPSAIQGGSPTLITLAAVALLFVSLCLAIFVLLPARGWRFVLGTKAILANYVETDPPATMAEIHRSLAWWIEVDWEMNQDMLTRRYALFGFSAVLVAGETILLLLSIAQNVWK